MKLDEHEEKINFGVQKALIMTQNLEAIKD